MNRQDITRIKGLSEIRRLPRLGKIRLGIKVKSPKTGSEYPKEVSYFVCPPEVQVVYSLQPTKLDIMFPLEDETKCFPQALKWYVQAGLRCKGDGERALRRAVDLVVVKDGKEIDNAKERIIGNGKTDDPNALVEIGCPCHMLERGDCSQVGNLMVLLPKVSVGGIYQIDTGSFHNIVRINSGIDYVRALVGRVSLVPLVLSRQLEEIEYEGQKRKHYLLQLTLNANLEEVSKLRENTRMILTYAERLSLPAPVEDGPDAASGAVVVEGDAAEDERAKDVTPPPNVESPKDVTPPDLVLTPPGEKQNQRQEAWNLAVKIAKGTTSAASLISRLTQKRTIAQLNDKEVKHLLEELKEQEKR